VIHGSREADLLSGLQRDAMTASALAQHFLITLYIFGAIYLSVKTAYGLDRRFWIPYTFRIHNQDSSGCAWVILTQKNFT
jgi:hypothetical protein